MYEFCTAEPKKIASILRFLPFGPVGAPPGLSFNGFRPASYPVPSVLGRCRGKGKRPSGHTIPGPRRFGCGCSGSGHPVIRFRDRHVGPGCPVAAFGCGIGRGSPLRRSGRGVSVAGFRVAAVRLRRRSGLSIEALRSWRDGRRVPGRGVSVAGFRVRGVPATPFRSGAAP